MSIPRLLPARIDVPIHCDITRYHCDVICSIMYLVVYPQLVTSGSWVTNFWTPLNNGLGSGEMNLWTTLNNGLGSWVMNYFEVHLTIGQVQGSWTFELHSTMGWVQGSWTFELHSTMGQVQGSWTFELHSTMDWVQGSWTFELHSTMGQVQGSWTFELHSTKGWVQGSWTFEIQPTMDAFSYHDKQKASLIFQWQIHAKGAQSLQLVESQVSSPVRVNTFLCPSLRMWWAQVPSDPHPMSVYYTW